MGSGRGEGCQHGQARRGTDHGPGPFPSLRTLSLRLGSHGPASTPTAGTDSRSGRATPDPGPDRRGEPGAGDAGRAHRAAAATG